MSIRPMLLHRMAFVSGQIARIFWGKWLTPPPAKNCPYAMIVGEPRVTKVYFKKEVRNLCALPGAKREAEMIARLLPGSYLFIGEQAT